jgi:hypothetical protein
MDTSIVFSRRHPILQARATQIIRNALAVKGGRPYVEARLWRAPNESDLSWTGTGPQRLPQNIGCVGRRDRACNVNDAGRIASKINQYLFQEAAARPGLNAEWARSATPDGISLSQFWQNVSTEITCSGWCWLQADRGAPETDEATGRPKPRSLARREESGDRLFWMMWPSTSVLDWHFDGAGRLQWLLTQETKRDNADPMLPARSVETRTIWRRGQGSGNATFQKWARGGQEGEQPQVITEGDVSSTEIPFVLVGRPSDEPWWFDDVELIQAQTMNLDSLYIEILARCCFPQLVVPTSMVDSLTARLVERAGQIDGERVIEVVKEIVRGMDSPIVESGDDKGVTRIISPAMSDMKAIPDEIARKRGVLFDQAGLALFNRETRQVQSAESKKFDHLDTEATLRARAEMLQKAEEGLVAISQALDTTWKTYEPTWPSDFDVTDLAADSAALSTIQGIGHLTLSQRKLLLKAATKLLTQLVRVDDDMKRQIDEEIDGLTDEDFSYPIPDWTGDGENEDEDEE